MDDFFKNKVIDAHLHLNLHAASPLESLCKNLSGGNVDSVVLILNTAEEKKYFRNHIREFCLQKICWHVGVLIDLTSGTLEKELFADLYQAGIPFSIKLHPRWSRLTLQDIPLLFSKMEEYHVRWENVIIDGFYYGSHLENQIGLELTVAVSQRLKEKRVIYSHSGGIHILETLVHLRDRKNVYYDLSLSCNYLSRTSVRCDFLQLLKFNKQRVMFGSDYPDFSLSQAMEETLRLCRDAGLTQQEQEAVFYGNAASLYQFSRGENFL